MLTETKIIIIADKEHTIVRNGLTLTWLCFYWHHSCVFPLLINLDWLLLLPSSVWWWAVLYWWVTFIFIYIYIYVLVFLNNSTQHCLSVCAKRQYKCMHHMVKDAEPDIYPYCIMSLSHVFWFMCTLCKYTLQSIHPSLHTVNRCMGNREALNTGVNLEYDLILLEGVVQLTHFAML